MNLIKLYKAGAVKRWHTKTTIKDQDVAAHSWGVALICMKIAPQDHELVRAALLHDMAECESGDIPYPFKRENPDLNTILSKHEAKFEKDNGAEVFLRPSQIRALKWADMFELMLWCKRELAMGNESMKYTIDVAWRALRDMGHPNEIARQLFEEQT